MEVYIGIAIDTDSLLAIVSMITPIFIVLIIKR